MMEKKRVICVVLALLWAGQAQAGTVKGRVSGGAFVEKSAAVVYLSGGSTEFKQPEVSPVMDQRQMTFIPHVLPIQVGTTVDFLNNDEVRHNVFSPSKEKYNLGTWPQGEIKQRTFSKKGVYTQLCNVHPEMEAFVVALDTPYFVTTSKDGSFSIEGVPAGSYTVKAWHDKVKFTKQKIDVSESGVAEVVVEPRKRKR